MLEPGYNLQAKGKLFLKKMLNQIGFCIITSFDYDFLLTLLSEHIFFKGIYFILFYLYKMTKFPKRFINFCLGDLAFTWEWLLSLE